MPMLLIEGAFHIKGARPDGDSIHFTPDDPTAWNLLNGPGRPVQHNGVGRTQLRLDAIDTLETHYGRSGREVHQPLEFAHAGADELLAFLGFTGVSRDGNETVTAVDTDGLPGYILTRGADDYGRCVALVGKGAPPAAGGTQVHVDIPMLQQTANHHLLSTGMAHPTYYTNLFPDLRDEFTAAVHAAQAAGAGLWPKDVTISGATVTGLSSLTDDVVILPKLFRRLVDYLRLSPGNPSLAGFEGYLAREADKYFILSTGHPTTGLDFVVEVVNSTVRMTHPAEDLVFDE
ncbi:nuclease [Kitasatospora sp. KL5]|uniref:nuclease n=1 Tax=Kitasatospora sp. KL5 TaxID=3425125 RepID=UPI003D6FAE9C